MHHDNHVIYDFFILDHRRNMESHIKKLTEEKLKLETDSQNLRIEVDT